MTPINERILSLDVFRGLTIVLMILVNSQNSSGYPILLHVDWNGCSLADLVFPSFLFIVGLTSVVSLSKQKQVTKNSVLYLDMVKRSIILFLIGLFLNIFPNTLDLSTLRVYGVLQRIALCYLVCAFIYLNTSFKSQLAIYVVLLVGYWFVITQLPAPFVGVNQLTPEGSWVAYIDQMLFSSAHLFEKIYDPEGFLSTFPSIATTLFGVMVGQLLLHNGTKQQKFFSMISIALLVLLLGGLWNSSFPINKNLWTSSFVLWTSGVSLLVFACCFGLIDILGYKKWAQPLKIFGMNALFVFILHVLLLKLQSAFGVTTESGALVNLKTLITNSLFHNMSPQKAGLLYAIVFILFNFLVALLLYRRKLFIRI